jgi:hypothetical protein
MLRYKSWLDTRLWFFLGLTMLSAQVVALYVSYPMDPVTTYPNGALGVTAAEMASLRSDEFRGYIWLRWFSTTMILFWPVFAIRLAGTGLEESAGREYFLSLPVTAGGSRSRAWSSAPRRLRRSRSCRRCCSVRWRRSGVSGIRSATR